MTTITKERIELFIKNPLENGLTRGEQMELARIALASLEAEPVAECIVEDGGMCIDGFGEYVGHSLPDGTHQLYTAPPAQVVPDEMYWQDAPVEGSSKAAAYATGWNACRAAMLHSAEPVSQAYKLNALDGNSPVTPDGWISCSERMPENIPGSCKEYLVFDGLNNKVHHDYWVVPDGDSAPVASFWNHYGAHVTHWMPLPEPPQQDGE
ncbi:DUF551 domain-containing protein [Escherichia coli]|nr:DUF551 domain-containing protein [Escherichia coli]